MLKRNFQSLFWLKKHFRGLFEQFAILKHLKIFFSHFPVFFHSLCTSQIETCMYTRTQRCGTLKNWTHVGWTIRWAERTINVSQLFPSFDAVVPPHYKQVELLAESVGGVSWKRGDCKTSGADGTQRLHTDCEDPTLNLISGKRGQF